MCVKRSCWSCSIPRSVLKTILYRVGTLYCIKLKTSFRLFCSGRLLLTPVSQYTLLKSHFYTPKSFRDLFRNGFAARLSRNSSLNRSASFPRRCDRAPTGPFATTNDALADRVMWVKMKVIVSSLNAAIYFPDAGAEAEWWSSRLSLELI